MTLHKLHGLFYTIAAGYWIVFLIFFLWAITPYFEVDKKDRT